MKIGGSHKAVLDALFPRDPNRVVLGVIPLGFLLVPDGGLFRALPEGGLTGANAEEEGRIEAPF